MCRKEVLPAWSFVVKTGVSAVEIPNCDTHLPAHILVCALKEHVSILVCRFVSTASEMDALAS